MSRVKKRRHKGKNKIKKLLLLFSAFIVIFLCSLIVYGEDVFYAMKTFLYEDKALEIKIKIEKNDYLDDLNLNFLNEGSCDVYLRGFVFIYPKIEGDSGTTLSNSSVKINYSNEECWFLSEDNYVYYTKPLKVGSRTENPMVESIEINLSEEEKRMLGSDELGIDIVMEAVQVNNFAYKYEWSIEEIEIEDYFKSRNKEESKEVIKLIFK